MAIRAILKQKQLSAARARLASLELREADMAAQVEAADEPDEELIAQAEQLEADLDATRDEVASLEAEVAEAERAQQTAVQTRSASPANPNPQKRSEHSMPETQRSGRGFACRSRCFESRAALNEFYARSETKEFLSRVRSAFSGAKRSISGAELSIPDHVLEVLRDNLNKYSKLITKVRKRDVRGNARQNVIGEVPEGVWMEMAGALNDLEFAISDIEMDGYKVGGVIIIDNYLLEDSDIALGEELLYMVGQAIGMALDKAIVYGKGPSFKMPVGFVTRLAETGKPSYWGANQAEWTDLHNSHVMKLSLDATSGEAFFSTLLTALSKAKRKYTATSEKVWVMNEATATRLLVKSLGVNSAAALVAGMNNTMPIIGGEIVTLEFIPDGDIGGGYLDEFMLVERDGAALGSSDQPLYIEDKTVIKGTARYDGKPVRGEAFVLVNIDNIDPTTSVAFASDHANTALNALIVTSAAGTNAGDTKVTVAGAVSATGTLKYIAGGQAVAVKRGQAVGSDWSTFKSGDDITVATGQVITVVELGTDKKVISVGSATAVAKAAV